MVKFLKIIPAASLLGGILLASGCHIDFFGIAASSDLDERLRERGNFTFIDNYSDRAPAVGNSYSFIVLTDLHIRDGKTWGLERMRDAITPEVKFVVVLGDITDYGSRGDMETFIDFAVSLRSKGVPCYPVIGNHDIFFGNWQVWKEYIGSTSYRIDGDVVTFFILDSANSFFGETQLDWLERELARTKRDVFVFTHCNLFAQNPADTRQLTDTGERARVVNILRNKSNAVFMGHLHKTFTHEAGNVKYITIDEYKDTKTYCLVTVTNDGKNTNVTYEFKEP